MIAAKELPAAFVDDLCSSQDAEIASAEDLYKVLRLRCVASNHSENLFLWLKDCMTVTCRLLELVLRRSCYFAIPLCGLIVDRFFCRCKALFFDCALDVFSEYRSNSSTFQWLCQLQDHVHNEQKGATVRIFFSLEKLATMPAK